LDNSNKSALLSYLEECNEKYCEDNGLCRSCRNPLKEYESKEELWGSIQTVEELWACPNNC